MKTPNLFSAVELHKHLDANACPGHFSGNLGARYKYTHGPDKYKNKPMRPEVKEKGLFWRIALAWLVFSGKADAVGWQDRKN